MLSEDRIRKMIRLADYEKTGSKDLKMVRYWKSDYVRLQVLKTLVSVVATLVLVACLVALYDLDYLWQHMGEISISKAILWVVGLFLIIGIPSVVVTLYRVPREYDEAAARVKEYDATLHEMMALYEEEDEYDSTAGLEE